MTDGSGVYVKTMEMGLLVRLLDIATSLASARHTTDRWESTLDLVGQQLQQTWQYKRHVPEHLWGRRQGLLSTYHTICAERSRESLDVDFLAGLCE